MNKMKSIEKIVDKAVQNALAEIHRELGFELKFEEFEDHCSLSSRRIGENVDRRDLLIAGAMMVAETMYHVGVYQRSAANDEFAEEAVRQYKDMVSGLVSLIMERINSQTAINAH